MSDKRQNNQLSLASAAENRDEAPKGLGEGTEVFTAKRRTESPAIDEKLMEEVFEREGLRRIELPQSARCQAFTSSAAQ